MLLRNTVRFFVPADTLVDQQFVSQDSQLAHQLLHVLRLRPGDQIEALDGLGKAYLVKLTQLDKRGVVGTILQQQPAGGEPQLAITLFAPLIRAERFEWLLQKATELGVTTIVPVISAQSIHGDTNPGQQKQERWQRIVREAAEQSNRGRLPHLSAPLRFVAACQQAQHHPLRLLLWEGRAVINLRTQLHTWPTPPPSAAILSGPEGGFNQDELETAQAHGIMPVSLGPRILRAETAPLVAATALFYQFGELDDRTDA